MKRICLLCIMFAWHGLVFGQKQINITSIEINGNEITKKEVILRELLFKINDTFNKMELEESITKSKNNLINLKLFNLVNITKNIEDDNAEIIITLIERWYIWPYPIIEISDRNFNSWWQEFKSSKYTDLSRLNYGIFLNWENFRGRNEKIKLKFRKGFKEHYLFAYEIPYINRSKTIGLNTHIQLFRRKKSFYKTQNDTLVYYTDNSNYTTKDYELNAELLYKKGIYNTHKLQFTYFLSNIDTVIINRNPYYLFNNSNSGSYLKFTYKFTTDHRNYIEYPLYGYYFDLETSKYFKGTSPVSHLEIIGKVEKHLELRKHLFLGSSLKAKWSSDEYQPYFAQKGFGFEDYVRGYEYYVIDGQDFWLSKTILKITMKDKTYFDIPYVNMSQFSKSYYAIYLSLFSDMGYITDNQNEYNNSLSNTFLFSQGISIDYVTYYDKLLRIEFSINHLREKGVFLHFSTPFG